MKRSSALLLRASLVLALLLPAPMAGAQDVAARMVEVKKACAAGDVEQGIRLLAELYVETNDATAFFNQARCYQQNAQPEKALAKFREYLRKETEITPEQRAEVERYMAELESDLRARDQTGRPGPAPPSPDTRAAITAPSPVSGATSERGTGMTGLRKIGIALGAAGAAGLVFGAIFGAKVTSIEQEIRDLPKSGREVNTEEVHRRIADGQRYETLQFIGYGFGAAALAAGATCFVLGRRPASEETLAIAPVIAPGLGGASLVGRF